MQGAIFEITEFFGEEVAREIIQRATRDKVREATGKEVPIEGESAEEEESEFGIKAGHA